MKIYVPSLQEVVEVENLHDKDIHIEDIASALAKQCRYNGNITEFYSVAEHCWLLADYARRRGKPPEFQMQILLHDAAEAYIGDVAYHIKKQLPFFIDLDKALTNKVLNKFMCNNPQYYAEIHNWDRAICIDEMLAMCQASDPELKGQYPLGVVIRNWDWKEARINFLLMYYNLREQIREGK